MVGEVLAGLSGFKAMFDIAQALKNMDDTVKRNAAVADLGEQIIAAQMRYSTAVEQVRELEAKITQFETWEAEKQRYQMKDYGGGTIAYELKPAMASGEPPHRLCPACYQNRKKGILQPTSPNAYRQQGVKCAECGKEFLLGVRVERSNLGRAHGTDFDVFGR